MVSSPAIRRSRVDLPQPDGPTNTTNSPSRTVRLTPRITSTVSNDLRTSRGTYTYRYLFPGLAGIAMFIILPLAYTVWIGFTNYSSRHLLGFDRVTEVLLGEVFLQGNVRYQFTLHAAPGGFRIVLHTGEADQTAATTSAESSILDEPAGSGGSAAPAAGTAETAGSGGAGSSGTAGA